MPRWLSFLSGLTGTAMIATGLVVWVVKRRQRVEKQGGTPYFGCTWSERRAVRESDAVLDASPQEFQNASYSQLDASHAGHGQPAS